LVFRKEEASALGRAEREADAVGESLRQRVCPAAGVKVLDDTVGRCLGALALREVLTHARLLTWVCWLTHREPTHDTDRLLKPEMIPADGLRRVRKPIKRMPPHQPSSGS